MDAANSAKLSKFKSMSKGNLFLGYGRGKIGDIVLTRGEGQQISRARNRSPRNPKTEKQMYQRAVMATVMQVYKAGKAIFDHSFQGKSVGLGNMSRFLSLNAKLLRAAIADDIKNSTVLSCVVSPGAVSPVPNAYRISEGTFPQGPIAVDNASSLLAKFNPETTAKIADVFTPGDIFTIVAIAIEGDTAITDTTSPASVFGYVRLEVKQTLDAAMLVSAAKFNDVFNISVYNASFTATASLTSDITLAVLFGAGHVKGCMGAIHSREDSGLRSTCDMLTVGDISWGVAAENIPSVWNAQVQGLGNSELILEGGDL